MGLFQMGLFQKVQHFVRAGGVFLLGAGCGGSMEGPIDPTMTEAARRYYGACASARARPPADCGFYRLASDKEFERLTAAGQCILSCQWDIHLEYWVGGQHYTREHPCSAVVRTDTTGKVLEYISRSGPECGGL